MSEKLRTRLIHALVSFLMAAGLLLPFMGILEPSLLSPGLLLPAAVIIVLFELACLNRAASFTALGAGLLAVAVWFFGAGGMLTVSDVVLATALRLSGIRTAIPLVASSAVIIFTVMITLVSCFACLRSVSVLPSAILCFAMILLIYLTGSVHMILWFLPALLAVLLILMTDRFPETPVLPLVPFAALVVAGAFLLSGTGIGSEEIREKADEFRQAVLDRLFFTEPRDVFSLSSEGLYPQGQNQLGGRPQPNDHPVMQVSAPRTVYLRGVIMNEYTGRNWRNTTGGRRYLRQSPRLADERIFLFNEDLPALSVRNALCEPSKLSVRMLSDSASTLFVPQRVRDLSPGGELVPYFSNSSELFVTRNLRAGDTYTVSAPLFMAGDSGLGTLIGVCSAMDDSRYEEIAETYTALPSHLEEPVYALAREAASVASSPYEKALAIQSWLSRSFRYTLDVAPQPEDYDFVTHFLLTTKEGYCTYFASAMTVLCRMVGLPARYIEGYIAEPDEHGEAIVTGLSAHAWTEVYFKGFGWLTFDATPRGRGGSDRQNSGGPSPSPEPEPTPEPPQPDTENTEDEPTPAPDDSDTSPDPTPSPTPEPTPEPDPDRTSDRTGEPDPTPSADPRNDPQREAPDLSELLPQLLLLLLLLLLAAAVLRAWFTSPSFRARRAKTEDERFDVWAQEITDLLRAENLRRTAGESPMAFGRRADRAGVFSVSLGHAGECLSLIRYSRLSAAETDTALLRDTSQVMRRELSRPALLRYFIRRFFVPLSKRRDL